MCFPPYFSQRQERYRGVAVAGLSASAMGQPGGHACHTSNQVSSIQKENLHGLRPPTVASNQCHPIIFSVISVISVPSVAIFSFS